MFNKLSNIIANSLEKQLQRALEEYIVPRIETILFSRKFAYHIREQTKQAVQDMHTLHKTGPSSPLLSKECSCVSFHMIIEEFLHEEVEVVTNSGVLQGVIMEVGENYMNMRESHGTNVIVPFISILFVREKGEGKRVL